MGTVCELGCACVSAMVPAARGAPQVFAPLARLLGLYSIKEELEALSFKHSQPRAHQVGLGAVRHDSAHTAGRAWCRLHSSSL